jgi:hypothetical protein
MRMFVSTLEWEAQTWYKSLLDASIDGWDSFQEKFTKRWANKPNNFSLIYAFDNIKKNEDETVIDFNAHFFKTYYKIPTTIRPNHAYTLNYYLVAFDGIFGIFLRHKEPQNLDGAQAIAIKLEGHFITAYGFILIHEFQLPMVKAVQEVLVSKDEPQLTTCQVPRDKQDDLPSGLDYPEPIDSSFESHAEFQEDEGEDFNTLEYSLVPLISEDEKFQEEEPQVNQVEISQHEIASFPIPVVVQEQLDQTPLQQEEPLLVQPKDDVPYTLPTILHPEVVL